MFAGKTAINKAMIPQTANLLVRLGMSSIPKIISITPDRATKKAGEGSHGGIIFIYVSGCIK